MEQLPQRQIKGTWVQTERAAHEAWAALMDRSPTAAKLLHLLVARVSDHNAVVASHKVLAGLLKVKATNTVKSALAVLKEEKWIEVRQVGDRGTVNAYVLNDRVAWTRDRDGLRYSLFSATVVISDEEQTDRDDLGRQGPLRQIPSLFIGERQLPTGPGLDPPSQPSMPGLEPDLPSRRLSPHDPDTGELL